MFKVLVIQALHGLSDDRAEFLINDRLSLVQFLGLGLGDRVPDAKTIWKFRERLTRAGAVDRLFRRFDDAVRAAGYICDVGADRRQFPGGGTEAAPFPCEEAGGQGREDGAGRPGRISRRGRPRRTPMPGGRSRPAASRPPPSA